jgi:carboxyl-terminal processing protease
VKVDERLFIEENNSPKRNGFGVLKFLFVLIAVTLSFYGGFRYNDFMRSGTFSADRLNYSSLDDLYNTIKQDYDGEIDANKLLEGAKKGLVEGLGDPYSAYLTASEATEYMASLDGTFEGIGAELDQIDGKLTIISVIDGSPAQKSGLQGGDVIAKVNDEVSMEWTPDQGVTKIRGEAGSVVTLTILRGSELSEVAITRAKITDPSTRWEIKDDNIGYLRISRFSEDTAELTRKAASEFKDKNVKGVVLDLRGNGGGYVTAAQSVAGAWLEYGQKVAEERNVRGVSSTITSNGPSTLNGIPTVVLVNSYTASASEIVAGALKDNGGAQLLGVKTYGKGVVQSMRGFGNTGAQLKLTIAKWYTPNGVNISGNGLEPDVHVELDVEAYQKTGVDNQLAEAIAILKK